MIDDVLHARQCREARFAKLLRYFWHPVFWTPRLKVLGTLIWNRFIKIDAAAWHPEKRLGVKVSVDGIPSHMLGIYVDSVFSIFGFGFACGCSYPMMLKFSDGSVRQQGETVFRSTSRYYLYMIRYARFGRIAITEE